jgi:hypothetical protein
MRIGEHESEVIYVKSGVRQGSHLGPLLFLLLEHIFEKKLLY